MVQWVPDKCEGLRFNPQYPKATCINSSSLFDGGSQCDSPMFMGSHYGLLVMQATGAAALGLDKAELGLVTGTGLQDLDHDGRVRGKPPSNPRTPQAQP